MSTKLKIALIVLAVAVLAFVVYYFKFKGAPVLPAPQAEFGDKTKKDTAPLPTDNDSFPLDMGSRGKNVVYLQRALNLIKPTNKLVADGIFLDQTRNALLLTVNAYLSKLPLDEKRFNDIIAMGNRASGA